MTKIKILTAVFACSCFATLTPAFAADSEEAREPASTQNDDRPGPPPGHRHHGPRLTEEQRNCLDHLIGAPGSGERPSREKMKAAFTACKVPEPKHGASGPPPEENASDTSGAE